MHNVILDIPARMKILSASIVVFSSLIASAVGQKCFSISDAEFCADFKVNVPVTVGFKDGSDYQTNVTKSIDERSKELNLPCKMNIDLKSLPGAKGFYCLSSAQSLIATATGLKQDTSCASPASQASVCKSSCYQFFENVNKKIQDECKAPDAFKKALSFDLDATCGLLPTTECVSVTSSATRSQQSIWPIGLIFLVVSWML